MSTGRGKGKGFLKAIVWDPISPKGLKILILDIKPGKRPAPETSNTDSPYDEFDRITVVSAISVKLDGRKVSAKEDCWYGPTEKDST